MVSGESASGCSAAQVDQLNEDFQSSLVLSSGETQELAAQPLQSSLASIFLVVLGLLSMMNQIYFRPTQSEWLVDLLLTVNFIYWLISLVVLEDEEGLVDDDQEDFDDEDGEDETGNSFH